MKRNNYILGVMMAAMALFMSWDKDNVGTVYEPTGTNISFMQEAISQTVSTASTDIVVGLSRFGAAGAYTAHYTLKEMSDRVFTDANQGTAVYEDGKSMTSIVLKADRMEKGKTYTVKLLLSDADVATADTVIGKPVKEVTVSVTCDFDWKDLGAVTNQSGFNDGAIGKVKAYEAATSEGWKVYKFEDIFGKGFSIIAKATDKTGTTFVVEKQAGWNYSSTYGDVTVSGKGTLEGKTLTLSLEHVLASVGHSFGVIDEVITLP